MTDYLQRGHAAIQSRNTQDALKWYELAYKENPKDAQALACLGQTLCWQGRTKEGVGRLRQAGKLLEKKARKKKYVKELLMLAEQLQFWNDYPGSVDLLKSSVNINGSGVRGYQLLALAYSRMNRKKNALSAGKKALQSAPDNAVLNILLATLEMAEGELGTAKKRLEMVLQSSFRPEEKYRAHKELARLLDKQEDFGQVFEHLHAAADLSVKLPEVQKQDAALVPGMLKNHKEGFDRTLFDRWPSSDFESDRQAPVFLIGFLRSGTTLTQQVLATHSNVFVADESDLIVSLSRELGRMSGFKGTKADQLRTLDQSGIRHLRDFYWNRAAGMFGDDFEGRLFLDKTTMNTIDIALINCVFPDAKVIFVMRDPRDVCLSCLLQVMTPSPTTVQLLNWRSTAEFYAQVMDWWMFIKPHLTLDYYEFRYEAAVLQFETTYKQVFEFLGLTWEPSAVDFHKYSADKFIASPSFDQVSRPLYSSSLSRWKNYEPEFKAIEELLDPVLKAYDYR